MPKKINYADMFTLRKDGRYMGFWHDSKNARHAIYDKDPEKLYSRILEKETPSEPTFADIAEAWHDKVWESYRDGTRACYASLYQRALDEQEGRKASEVTAADVATHMQKLANEQMSAKSVKTLRTIYKLVYQSAIIDDYFSQWVTVNPALNAPVPKNTKPPEKREAPEDEIVKAIRNNAQTAYFGLYAMLLISTGFRRGEALALTWSDIDRKNKTIACRNQVIYRKTEYIAPTKTEAGVRTVPLLPDLSKLLVRPKGAKGSDYIFPSENGSFLPQSTFKRHWAHYCKDMGFITCVLEEQRTSEQGKKYIYRKYKNTLTSHVLRHSYATMLYDAGVDVYTAQKLLGHANIETTLAIYTHLSKRKKEESIAKLQTYAKNGYTLEPKAKQKAKKEKTA